MTDWLDQYSRALDLRDAREHAHKPYIDAFTRLADRTAAVVAAAAAPQAAHPTGNPTLSSHSPTPKDKAPLPTKEDQQQQQPPPPDLLTALRSDLTTTQRARSNLQTKISDLTSQLTQLQKQTRISTSQITTLTKQKADVERRLRDREEEIRGKAGLVEQAQDEMVALGLQLNLSEERSGRLEKENKELVERWMKRMGEEVERVNRDSRWE